MSLNKKENEAIRFQKLKAHINRLTWDFLQQFSEEKEDNLVFSPFSIFLLLAMAADATDGRTKKEITDDLFNGDKAEEVLSALPTLLRQIDEGNEFSAANAILVKENIRSSIQPNYPDHLKELFQGELFAAEDMVSAVNSWVEKQTRGMIREIANDSMKEMLFCLINACTFEDQWKEVYEDHQVHNEDFYNSDGTVSRVKMLLSDEPLYFENSDFTGFAKPYKGDRFSFVALLPKDTNGLTEKSYSPVDFSDCLAGTKNVEASVLMPEFQCSSEYELTGFMEAKGIRTIFTPEADFSPISSEWLKADGVLHKAHIEVDRKGTKAAAASSMLLVGSAWFDMPEIREVRLDRPYIWFIVHQETGVPIFSGMVRHLDPLGENEDRLSDLEKEEICRPIYEKICSIILDEGGIQKDEYERGLCFKTHDAYEKRLHETLKQIEAGLAVGEFLYQIRDM